MVEVVVAAVLFAAASAGVFATISFTNRSLESNTRVQAATFGKKILDRLRGAVVSATWNTGDLSIGTHTINVGSDADFPACSAVYVVSDAGNGARKVEVNATCP